MIPKRKENTTGAVMVVGGGIAGVQASLDLAEMGYYVYLVEKKSSIGGVMAQLDKTFPTNDCSLCILSPKLVEAGRHPNIKIITQAKIEDIKGKPGNFQVRILKRPRYIDETKCTACGVCSSYCPTVILDNYNAGLSVTKSIHIDYPQAVPSAYVVDTEACLLLNKQQCKICFFTCKAGAIDFSQKEGHEEISVGAVILAPGFSPFDVYVENEYGYASYPNVVTSMEFERIMCASGPYEGEILRPSDKRHPKRIAFIQCIGSRNHKNPYCSAVCCMYAIKEATVSKEHDSALDITIFYMDIRAQGKGFDEFFNRAQDEYGIHFIRSRVAKIKEVENHNLLLRYSLENGKTVEEEFDLVVLSIGLVPPDSAHGLSKGLKIGLNKHGFCRTSEFSPVNTTKEGIYVAGAFQGPKDIPESVIQASGAAACASTLLASARNTLMVKKEYPPEMEIEEEPRIGVFVCHCGINIGGVVNVPEVKRYAATLNNVVFSDENLYSCSADTQQRIKEMIGKHRLNRVVVAACTPRTHEPLFQETIREAGLNQCLFEFANIRDQCSWVHMAEKKEATEKAKDLVRMAVAKARLLKPLKEEIVNVTSKALIIGGGLAGMTATLALANQGFECYLVEKEAELGGNLKNIYYTLEGNDPQRLLKGLITETYNHEFIHVFTRAKIKEVTGYIGNFNTVLSLENEELEFEHGVVIVATGGHEYLPHEYLYNQDDRIMTQLQLEKDLATSALTQKDLNTVVMIQCVGSRTEQRPYCSKICCSQAIKNALKIKEINPRANIYIFYRDIRTYGFREGYYAQARAKGVIFIRYDKDNPPQVEKINGQLRVTGVDPLLEKKIIIEPDLLALSVAIVPSDNKELSQQLKTPLTSDGFFLEAHVKLQPIEAAVNGIFYAGISHFPKPIDESISQALASAAKATITLAKGYVEVEPIVSSVDKDLCNGCGICERLCPYKAIRTVKIGKRTKAETVSASCKGCGICAAHCPKRAITMGRFRDEQIMAQIAAFGSAP
jgi:heterodisulfide reductase subunit A